MAKLPSLAKTTEGAEVSSDPAVYTFGVLATSHFHVTLVAFRRGEQALQAEFRTTVLFADGVLDDESLSQSAVVAAFGYIGTYLATHVVPRTWQD